MLEARANIPERLQQGRDAAFEKLGIRVALFSLDPPYQYPYEGSPGRKREAEPKYISNLNYSTNRPLTEALFFHSSKTEPNQITYLMKDKVREAY